MVFPQLIAARLDTSHSQINRDVIPRSARQPCWWINNVADVVNAMAPSLSWAHGLICYFLQGHFMVIIPTDISKYKLLQYQAGGLYILSVDLITVSGTYYIIN